MKLDNLFSNPWTSMREAVDFDIEVGTMSKGASDSMDAYLTDDQPKAGLRTASCLDDILSSWGWDKQAFYNKNAELVHKATQDLWKVIVDPVTGSASIAQCFSEQTDEQGFTIPMAV